MPTSETTLVRRELVAVVREKDQMRTEFDGYKKRAEARFAADAGTISELRLENASQAVQLKARAASPNAGSACPDCGVIAEFESQMREIAEMYGEGHEIRTALLNALPTTFTFLKHAGMPSQNNRAEQELHAGPAREKCIRRQLKNQKGMKCMSVLSTVFRTAENLGIWPSTAVWMAVHVPGWNMMDHADGPGPPCKTQARSPQVPGAAA